MAQLCQHIEELEQLKITVLLISFGPADKAVEWQEEMCPSFQLLIDTRFESYRSYKLRHSWQKSWSLKTVLYYIRALTGGRKWRGIIGDPAQLGGDFIIERDGTFLLEHRSKESTDRPAVKELMELLKK